MQVKKYISSKASLKIEAIGFCYVFSSGLSKVWKLFYAFVHTKLTIVLLFVAPSSPVNVQAHATSHNEIVVEWKGPKHPNGLITHYIVDGIREKDSSEFISQRNYCNERKHFEN